jgi:pimeloyl-ACP methyl ester carboxylesterase
MHVLSIQTFGAAVAIALLPACSGTTPPQDGPTGTVASEVDARELAFDVAIRGTGTASLHAHVYANPTVQGGINVLAVHGLAETGFIYGPLAQAIFADRALGPAIGRIVAIDLPGHGDTPFPTGLPEGVNYGDLLIEDNASVVIQAIDALRRRGLGPSAIIAHSMGGLEVLIAQQTLLGEHSSLAAHGVFAATLLAPVPPHGQEWVHPPFSDLSSLLVNDPTLGTYLVLPAAVFVQLAFTTTSGQVASDAPTAAEVVANRYVGPEPLNTLLELEEAPVPLADGGSFTIDRPTVNAGAFAPTHGTLLSIVSFSEDTLVPAVNLGPLYEYLTGDSRDLLYHPVTAPDAVHEMLISNPTAVLAAIRPMF